MHMYRWLLCCVILAACGPRKFPKPDFSAVTFAMTSQDQLFFKNVRSYYYQQDLDAFPGVELYRWKPVEQDSTQLWLRPIIAMAYQQGQCFLLTETSAYLRDSMQHVLYAQFLSNRVDSIRLEPQSMEDHLCINAFVYNAIDDSARFYLYHHNGSRQELLHNETERNNIRKMIRDYLRITAVL